MPELHERVNEETLKAIDRLPGEKRRQKLESLPSVLKNLHLPENAEITEIIDHTKQQEIIQELKKLEFTWWKCPAQDYDGVSKQYHEGTDVDCLPCLRNVDFDCTPFLQLMEKSQTNYEKCPTPYMDHSDELRRWKSCPLWDKEKRKVFTFKNSQIGLG